MFAFLYFTLWSMVLLIAETLLRSAGLTVPLLAFFYVAASFAVSPGMALCFALVFGIAQDFVMGCFMPWDGLVLAVLTLPAVLLHAKRPGSDALEFLCGAMIPLFVALPSAWTVLTTPEAFASLLTSCLLGAILLPVMFSLVSRSADRLKIGVWNSADGGE